MKNKLQNVDLVKVASVAGTVLGVASTLLGGWSQNRAMKDEVAKEVAKAIKNAQ